MFRWLPAALLAVFASFFGPPGEASRAELDGRGLPHLLALDATNLVLFPGSAAQFGSSALVDYSGYGGSSLSIAPLVPPVVNPAERLAMALTGKSLAFGYVLDGPSHNLVLSHQSGWGASLGISDVYEATERTREVTFGSNYEYISTSEETSRRDLRLTLGWAGTSASGRLVELAVGGDLVYAQQFRYHSRSDLDSTVTTSSAWESEPGFNVDVRLRTLSLQSGFQGVVRFAYEDLQPKSVTGGPATWIRRYALAELGWRLPVKAIDDLQVGAVVEWSQDSFTGQAETSAFGLLWENRETTRYFGAIFASGEHAIVGRWIGRAGVRGSAYLQEQKSDSYEQDINISDRDTFKRTTGEILRPEFFLGVGWSWKQFTLDGRIRESIDLTNPVSQWSVGYSW